MNNQASENPGAGGSGGGGAGGAINVWTGNNGTVNTGGGGGGGSASSTGGSGDVDGGIGGSGIVILRTTKSAATFSAGVVVNGTGPTTAGQSVNGDTSNMPTGQYFYSITTASNSTITFS